MRSLSPKPSAQHHARAPQRLPAVMLYSSVVDKRKLAIAVVSTTAKCLFSWSSFASCG
jgi:hypothetical protein